MKAFIIPLFLVLISCADKKEKGVNSTPPEKEMKILNPVDDQQNPVLNVWVNFYKKDNPDFAVEKFVLRGSSPISYNPSNVTVMNEEGFNELYKPFLIFNESKTKYLDFDSYQWSVAKDGRASFEADQQVALVDFTRKTAAQITFFGPSYTIEQAYWKNDSAAVLLGNSYEKVPFIIKFNFDKNTMKYFQYPDTLKFETPYSKVRLQDFGIRTD